MSAVSSRSTARRGRVLAFLVLTALAALIVYPVYVLLVTSTRTNLDYLMNPLGWPQEWTWDNFRIVWENYGAGAAFLNSAFVVSIALVIALILATLAGYALAKFPPPGAKLFTGAFVSVMLIPSQVLILPIYLMLSKMQLVGDYWGLILLYVATNLPFGTFFMMIVFKGLPDEILEAARVDGAGFFRTLVKVALPISWSGVATLGVLQFMSMWNELLFALVLLPSEATRLLTPALSRLSGEFTSEQPLIAAGLLIAASLPVLLLMVSSRSLIRGISAGAIR